MDVSHGFGWKTVGRAAGILALVVGSPAIAQAGSVDVQYAVSLAGLNLGTATLTGAISPSKYSLSAQAHLTGLAGMVTGGKGAVAATGNFAGGQVVPGNYSLTACQQRDDPHRADGHDRRHCGAGRGQPAARCQAGPCAGDQRPPSRRARSARRRIDAHGPQHRPRGPATAPSRCSTAPSASISSLTYAGTQDRCGQGRVFRPGVVCKARYTPIAGHRSERAAVKFMAEQPRHRSLAGPQRRGRHLSAVPRLRQDHDRHDGGSGGQVPHGAERDHGRHPPLSPRR
jgi:hypothetical protein